MHPNEEGTACSPMRASKSDPFLTLPPEDLPEFRPASKSSRHPSKTHPASPVSSQVIIRDEKGIPAGKSLASWAGSLRGHGVIELLPLRTGQAVPGRGSPKFSREPDLRQELGLPPNMLKTFAPTIERENDINAGRMRALGLPQAPPDPSGQPPKTRAFNFMGRRKSKSSSAPSFQTQTEEEYAHQADTLKGRVDRLRQRHASFEPLTAAKAKQLAEAELAAASKKTVQHRSPGEFRDCVQAWKFVRKIEPELPPLATLESLGPSEEPPFPKEKVLANSTSQALEHCKRQERLNCIASRASDLRSRHLQVAEQRKERKATGLEVKREHAQKHAGTDINHVGSVKPDDPGSFQDIRGQKQSWLTILAIAGFAHCLKEEMNFGKLSCRQKNRHIDRHSKDIAAKTIFCGTLMRQTIEIREKLTLPAAVNGFALLSCMLAKKVHVTQRRNHAKVMSFCLTSWSTSGVLFTTMKRMAHGIRLLQRSWREWRVKLRKMLNQVTSRWVALERQVIVRELREASNKSKAVETLTYENQIALKRVEDHARLHFLIHEMRARRYFLLPKLRIWAEEQQKWEATSLQRKREMECIKFLGGQPDEELPLFLFVPPAPSYQPDQLEIVDMIFRARKGDHYKNIPEDCIVRC